MHTKYAIAVVVVLFVSASFVTTFYNGAFEDKNSQKSLGPTVVLSAYGKDGTSVSPIMNNLSIDLSIWVPSSNGEGKTINLNSSAVNWNQTIPLGPNFIQAVNAWKSFMNNKNSEPTMSLLVFYTKVIGSSLEIFEYYTNIPFNPFSANLVSQVFINNFTMNLVQPLTTIPLSSNNTPLTALSDSPSPMGEIGPGPCPPGDEQTVWTDNMSETGWYPLYIINSTVEPSNEELSLTWASTSFQAQFEFDGLTSTNGVFLSSANGYATSGLVYNTQEDTLVGNSQLYDLLYLTDTTVTWSFGKEEFFQPYGSNECEYLGSTPISVLKVEYSGASSITAEGFSLPTGPLPSGSTYGNSIFDEYWAEAVAYGFSNEYTNEAYNFTIPAGSYQTVSDFDIQSSSNLNSILNQIKDEGAEAMVISATGMILAIMAAAASAFPGGSTAADLGEIATIASIGGFIDSVVNLASSFTLVVSTQGSLQTMTAWNQIVNGADPTSSVKVTMYDTGGNTYFNNNSVSYLARTPYVNVTAA